MTSLEKMSPSAQLKYFGKLSQEYLFDLEKFKTAIIQLKSQDKEFKSSRIDKGLSKWDFPKNYYDLLGVFHEPIFDFKFLRISKLAIQEKPIVVRIKGDVVPKGFAHEHILIHGDLYVEGNLVLGTGLYVTGNLIVDGLIKDSEEWTPFLIGGSIEAKGMDVGGQVYCAGSVTADCICIDGTGKLYSKDGLAVKLLIEEGYEHEIDGDIDAVTHIDFRAEDKPEKGIQALKEVLDQEVFEPIEKEWKEKGDEFYFAKKSVVDVLRDGRNVLKMTK